MSDFLISALIGISVGAWTYNKFNQRTGGDVARAVGSGATVGVLAFIIFMIILKIIGNMIS